MSSRSDSTTYEKFSNMECIDAEQKKFFLDNGYLVLRNVVQGEELKRLRDKMTDLMSPALEETIDHPDYMYKPGHVTGNPTLARIEYVIDKVYEARVLLGHPYILRSVEKITGPDLIPTWDSMVLKLPGEGIKVPWHRDSGAGSVGDVPIFNVDFYLDPADEDTCLWAYPGSHRWTEEQIRPVLDQEGFSTEGAVPLLMSPGDVLFHDILLLHGSPSNTSNKLRRVLYYEFRTASVESVKGPHTPEYIPIKQRVLMHCIDLRKQAPYIDPEEKAFDYNPPEEFSQFQNEMNVPLETLRFPHENYWRKS